MLWMVLNRRAVADVGRENKRVEPRPGVPQLYPAAMREPRDKICPKQESEGDQKQRWPETDESKRAAPELLTLDVTRCL